MQMTKSPKNFHLRFTRDEQEIRNKEKTLFQRQVAMC